MARPWIRLYTSICDSGKIQRLPDHLFKFLINCWALTGDNDDALPAAADIAWRLRMDPGICQAYIFHLTEIGLLVAGDKIVPHNWNDRQFLSDDSKKRVRNFRDKHKKRDSNGDVTATVTTQETEAETEQIQSRAETERAASPPAESGDSYLEQFTAAIGKYGFGNPEGNTDTAYFTARVAEVCEQAGATPQLGAFVASDLIKSDRFRGKPLEYLIGALRGELAPKGQNQKALRKASDLRLAVPR